MTLKNAAAPVKSPDKLKLMIMVVNREKSEYYNDLIQSFGVNVSCFVSARGTARSEMLELLGADDRKSAILGVVQADRAPEILEKLAGRFATVRNGKGIAFTVPLTSVIGVSTYRFLADKREKEGLF